MPTRDSGIGLTKAVEDVRQEVWFNSDTGVLDCYLHMGVNAFEDDLDVTAFRRELHCVAEQIPKDLMQASRIAPHRPNLGIDQCLDANGFVFC